MPRCCPRGTNLCDCVGAGDSNGPGQPVRALGAHTVYPGVFRPCAGGVAAVAGQPGMAGPPGVAHLGTAAQATWPDDQATGRLRKGLLDVEVWTRGRLSIRSAVGGRPWKRIAGIELFDNPTFLFTQNDLMRLGSPLRWVKFLGPVRYTIGVSRQPPFARGWMVNDGARVVLWDEKRFI